MGLLTYIILLAIIGLVVGAFARLALPGRDPMSVPMTIGIGLAGSFIGGFVSERFLEREWSFLLAVVFAAAIVYFIRRSRGGGLTDPGAPRGY